MKRQLKKETEKKVLKMASEILRMHAKTAGGRICQDWTGTVENSPLSVFTKEELDDLSFNHELDNSDGRDYDPACNGMGDEMVASFSIASALDDMI